MPHALNEAQSLIYMWEIRAHDGSLLGRYVGKAKAGAHRPLKHYVRNVANILSGKPYRKGNPEGFRRIHRALADAESQGHLITLNLLCNVVSGENLNEVEQQHIRLMNSFGSAPWQLNE
jgi:hypothetical protein